MGSRANHLNRNSYLKLRNLPKMYWAPCCVDLVIGGDISLGLSSSIMAKCLSSEQLESN